MAALRCTVPFWGGTVSLLCHHVGHCHFIVIILIVTVTFFLVVVVVLVVVVLVVVVRVVASTTPRIVLFESSMNPIGVHWSNSGRFDDVVPEYHDILQWPFEHPAL
jgi:hypothetical protein